VDERTALLEWQVAGRPLPGEERSGDGALVVPLPDGALAAAVDGLGHGPEAAAAADAALDALRRRAEDDVVALVEAAHDALGATRGAALSLAMLHCGRGTMTWVGVGNVEGRLVRGGVPSLAAAETLVLHRGVLGHALPALRPTTLRVRRGDLLILATDGILPAFADGLVPTGTCGEIAARVIARHARETDDALVLVARCLGGGPPRRATRSQGEE
jgi:phosphoserine phosphatase RsbX